MRTLAAGNLGQLLRATEKLGVRSAEFPAPFTTFRGDRAPGGLHPLASDRRQEAEAWRGWGSPVGKCQLFKSCHTVDFHHHNTPSTES